MINYKKKFDHKKTYFEQHKIKNKIPTIFIHGVGLDNTMWFPQKKNFLNNSTIFYDILNHGKSKKGFTKLHFKNFVSQLEDLITFIGVKKINLVGFSIGALIAQHYTESNYDKVNKLVLIASVYKRSKTQIEIIKKRFKNASKGKSITIDSINRWFSISYLKKNPNIFNFFFDLLEKKNNSDFLSAYKVFVESDKSDIDFTKFNMPTLIMTGEKEIGSTPLMSRNLNKKIKKSFFYIIKDAKHGATIEKEKEVNYQLQKFLNK